MQFIVCVESAVAENRRLRRGRSREGAPGKMRARAMYDNGDDDDDDGDYDEDDSNVAVLPY